MFRSLEINGYRCFERFEMTNLGRINLLVGSNNGGKTSVLEAVHVLSSGGDPDDLRRLLDRRGERLTPMPNPERSAPLVESELEIRHLFRGHEVRPGTAFSLSAGDSLGGNFTRNLRFFLTEATADQHALFSREDDSVLAPRLVLNVVGSPNPPVPQIGLTRRAGLGHSPYELSFRSPRTELSDFAPCEFVGPESIGGDYLANMWNQVVLTPDEQMVVDALKFVDPAIERIASRSVGGFPTNPRASFIVKRRGLTNPVPLGSMGEGMWRMLALALAVTQCRGGTLVVDDVDTGLHYRVMTKMWEMLYGAAKRLDVQIFATTHSYDCVYSLAQLRSEGGADSITVQRIEAGRGRPVPYDEEDIAVAAARDIEVR